MRIKLDVSRYPAEIADYEKRLNKENKKLDGVYLLSDGLYIMWYVELENGKGKSHGHCRLRDFNEYFPKGD